MIDLYLYRYSFKEEPVPPSLFTEGEHLPPLDELARVMGEREMKFYQTRPKGQTVSYRNRIANHDGVSLMHLQNNKNVTIADPDFTEHTEGNYPYVCLIVDHRPGHQLIAIEKASAFSKRKGDDNSTQRVASLLAEAVNNHLSLKGWEIEIMPVARSGDLWLDVLHRVVDLGKRVRTIEYRFPADEEEDTQTDTAWYMFSNFAHRTGGTNGIFQTLYERGDATDMERAERDIRAMETWASRERYEINVHFRDDSEVLRAGAMLYSHKLILERDTDDFISGARGLDGQFMLVKQLDEIYNSIEEDERN